MVKGNGGRKMVKGNGGEENGEREWRGGKW